MRNHGIPDSLFAKVKSLFSNEGVVELTTLVGYFVAVCWIMNVARTKTDEEPEFGLTRG